MDSQAGPRRSTDESVELSGDAETGLDTPLVEDRETRSPEERKPVTVFGVSVPRSDAKSALPTIAQVLAQKHSLPTDRVTSCLQRLFEAEFRRQKIIYGKVLWSFRAGLLSILPLSLECMPAEKALAFSEAEDLNAYKRRVLISQALANEFTPLLSLDELARTISEFIEHQEKNQKSLLETGHPKTHFAKSPWLDAHLNKLYFTKSPIWLKQTGQSSTTSNFRPVFHRMYVDQRRIAQRTTGHHRHTLEFMRGSLFSPPSVSPPCQLQWANFEEGGWVACSYDNAHTLAGLPIADIPKVEGLRTALQKTKIRVLAELSSAIRDRDDKRVGQRCLEIISKELTAEEATYLLYLDVGYAGYEVRTVRPETRSMPLFAGGLTSLLELIGHVKKELVIGTLAKTREALSKTLVLDVWRKPRFVTLVDRSKYKNLGRTTVQNPYLELVAVGMESAVREGLDLCVDRDADEPAFWSSYRDEVEQALSSEFYTLVPVRVKKCFQPKFQTTLQEFADEKAKRLESEEDPALGARSPNIFRRMGDDWNIRYAGGNPFAIPDLVGLTYIHQLIEKPGQSFSGQDLRAVRQRYEASNTSRSGSGARQAEFDDSIETSHVDHGGKIMDKEGLKEIRALLAETEEELQKANDQHDEAEIARLEKEKAEILKLLQGSTDLKGQSKLLQEENQRAKRAVKKAINTALDRISQKDFDLSQHLRNSIHSNGFEYRPEPKISWETC